MEGENRPEKRLKLDDANNHEQDEIKRLKKVVKEQEEMLASKTKKLLEMEESKNKVEREKDKVEREKIKVEEEKIKVEERLIKVEDEKLQFEVKLQKLVECHVCLTLPRNGPVPCCANGHHVCSPCLEKLRGEDNLEQG